MDTKGPDLETTNLEVDGLSEYLATDEIVEAIQDIIDSSDKRLILYRIAQHACSSYRLHAVDPEEIVSQTIVEVFSGQRKCPRSMDPWVFIKRNLRWVCRDQLRLRLRQDKLKKHAQSNQMENLGVQRSSSAEGGITGAQKLGARSSHPGADQRLIALEMILEILSLFDDDPVAQNLALKSSLGYEGEDLRTLLGLDEKAFASKRRLVRRRIEKHLPDRGTS